MPITSHNENIVELSNVSFSYGANLVLSKITFNVHRGDYLGIIGPNGSGKTTLLKIMVGLIDNFSGEVKLFGQNIKDFKNWEKIGYVSQNATDFDVSFPVTVEEVVSMGRFAKKGLFKGLTSYDRDIISQVLIEVEMEKFRSVLIGNLSGGQKQRVFIARAMASQPEIIFLDEPTVGIDLESQERFYSLLAKLNQKRNLTLALVSHDVDVVAHETTEVACVNQTLVYHGLSKDFIGHPNLENLYGKGVKFILHGH